MKFDLTELVWIDESVECTLRELSERSRLTAAEIMELVAYGVLPPDSAPRRLFPAQALAKARAAARLRDDFEIDLRGVALALTLLQRINDLEARLQKTGH